MLHVSHGIQAPALNSNKKMKRVNSQEHDSVSTVETPSRLKEAQPDAGASHEEAIVTQRRIPAYGFHFTLFMSTGRCTEMKSF